MDNDLVRAARAEEIANFKKHNVNKKVPSSQCVEVTGKQPIGLLWVDTNKGDESAPDYRSRLCAREVKRSAMDDMFAATPPLEAKNMLMSLAVSCKGCRGPPNKLLFVDVRRAYFHAPARRPVFVHLPDEDATPGMCGMLLKSLYGTRDAAANWERAYTAVLVQNGWVQGLATPCVFTHPSGAKLVVHGDDFTFMGTDNTLDSCQKMMEDNFEVKIRGRLGPEPSDDKLIRILNRLMTWSDIGILYEGDPRHAEIIVQTLGMNIGDKSTVTTPGSKIEEQDTDVPLGPHDAHCYRSLVARANFLALDRADIQFATNELSRFMQAPTQRSWDALMRLGKFLKLRPRYVQLFEYPKPCGHLNVYVDSDCAGEGSTRTSTSGGAACLNDHPVKTRASTQNVIALSTGEAECMPL